MRGVSVCDLFADYWAICRVFLHAILRVMQVFMLFMQVMQLFMQILQPLSLSSQQHLVLLVILQLAMMFIEVVWCCLVS